MVRIIVPFFLLLFSCQLTFGKPVDENTAQNAGYNFCKAEGSTVSLADLSLAYEATSTVNGGVVTDFYVFNTGAKGFVIVSGDDAITPVLAYSTESAFNGAYIPDNIAGWLNNYKSEISFAIKNNSAATAKTQEDWNSLLQGGKAAAARTTSGGVVLPLLPTNWNQSPYYNFMCPYDAGAGANAVTGCVATAMAQVMKYWNWPERGVGSHSYYDGGYGTLSADFGSTVYQWDSMHNEIGNNNVAVGTLMYQAGVSVNMSYGVTGSAAYVLAAYSPIANCTQYALENYFSYKSSTLRGVARSSYDDSDWVNLIKSELDAGRPVIYTGDGSEGGHCFVADGYITYDRFHFNWGWGGYANGYFIVENLAPGEDTFYNDQTLLTGIEPDSSVTEGVHEVAANSGAVNIYPNPASDIIHIDMQGTETTEIRLVDAEGRMVKTVTPAANAATETISVSGLPDGMYIAELQTTQGVLARKVVIAR